MHFLCSATQFHIPALGNVRFGTKWFLRLREIKYCPLFNSKYWIVFLAFIEHVFAIFHIMCNQCSRIRLTRTSLMLMSLYFLLLYRRVNHCCRLIYFFSHSMHWRQRQTSWNVRVCGTYTENSQNRQDQENINWLCSCQWNCKPWWRSRIPFTRTQMMPVFPCNTPHVNWTAAIIRL